ncbi:MAG TPA: ROK family transcriptional regulator [Pyrinomonadaceae bacterium]|nr:ROK family transcriptional regulator [Pyrinomonadaceae bacterium]
MRRIDLRTAQAAHSHTIRNINRQIVLNYVREREPISRAEIAREMGLQRSTISTIVDQLQADGLIEEVGAGVSTGGRRPTLLRLRTVGAVAIGVDITPSRTTIATSDLAGRVLQQEQFATNPDYPEMLSRVIERVRALSRSKKGMIESVGMSVPGLVDPETGRVIYVPYFKWRDLDIAQQISSATGLSVTIDNDANAAALAELWFGRPEVLETRDFIMVLVAEGVGTGIIFDGQIYRGEQGAAGEFGHMIIGAGSAVACSCGNYDCWEAFSSERAAVARYLKLSGRTEDHGHTICLRQLVSYALDGEEAARAALSETAHFLGIGISNLIVGLSPEAVVVGGAIARAWPLIAESLREPVEKSIRRGLPSARIIASTLGEQPTLMGALSLVLANKFASASAA